MCGPDYAEVRETLNSILDPCSVAAGASAGLIDMGLVSELEVSSGADGATIRLTINITEPGCMMGFPFANEARQRLLALAGVRRVEVSLGDAYRWTPADMTDEYRARLERVRSARRRALLRGWTD